VPIIADAKRGDIGSTAARHAAAIFDGLGAHAVTASPYLGAEAIEPLLGRSDRFVCLCRTSNPGAGRSRLTVAADPGSGRPAEALYERIAALAVGWAERFGTVGLVVGATAPELTAVRAIAPSLPFPVPGVGAQGGDLLATLADGPSRIGAYAGLPGGGLLVNISRGISGASMGATDPGEAMAEAAAEWSRRTPVLP
jgi:orotidine-5'-phosphate decarboxylase